MKNYVNRWNISDSDEDRSTATESDIQKSRLTTTELQSRQKYQVAYKRFTDWCVEKKIGLPTESDCLAFFIERGNCVKPNSLWTEYSMINAFLVPERGVDLKQFSSLTEFMKGRALGYKCKTSKVFTKEQIMKFVRDAPDLDYLMMKVWNYYNIS